MNKIPTLFRRNPDNMAQVLPEVHPDCQWVLDGEGIATRKYDGGGDRLSDTAHKLDQFGGEPRCVCGGEWVRNKCILRGTLYGAGWDLGQAGIQLRNAVIVELKTLYARIMPPRWLQERIQLDRLHNQGRAVGLSKPETNEVIYAWIAWYQTTPWPVDFEIIGKALTVRALGEDWTPPLGGGNR